MEKVIEIFRLMGVAPETLEKIKSNPESIEQEKVIADISKHVKTLALQDHSFTGPIKAEVKGAVLQRLEKDFRRQFDIPKEITAESFEDLLPAAREHLNKTYTEKFEGKNNADLLKQTSEMENANRKLQDELHRIREVEMPAKLAEAMGKVEQHIVNIELERYIEKKPLAGPAEVYFAGITNMIDKKGYQVVRENGNLKLVNKEGNAVMEGDNIIELDRFVDSHLKSWNAIKQSNGNGNNNEPADRGREPANNGGAPAQPAKTMRQLSPEAQAHLDKLKQEAGVSK